MEWGERLDILLRQYGETHEGRTNGDEPDLLPEKPFDKIPGCAGRTSR
jgi:hypothetical protein